MENFTTNTKKRMPMKKRILFIIKNENEASSRFRVSAYLPYLKNDFECEIFYSEYNNKKIPKFLRSIIKRVRFLKLILNVTQYDILFMQRPMSSDKKKSTNFEHMMAKLNPNIIFDFDDALFVQNEEKIISLIKLSKNVICGNNYLAHFSKQYNPNTFIVPTTIDTSKFTPSTEKKDIITLGWTGTSGNYVNFSDQLLDAIKKILSDNNNIKFLFICDRKPPEKFDFPYDFIYWAKESEVKDLQKIDIGLMPLIDSPWTRGKCGFKLIQYGSIAIASIGSDVGVNSEIIIDSQTGYLIKNEDEWMNKIQELVTNINSRVQMGINARKKIEQDFDTSENYIKLKKIFYQSESKKLLITP